MTEPKLKEGNLHHKIDGSLEFYNVSYTYPNTGIEALKNISFKVKPGERIAVVGRTGSGKSTIAALITRLVDASTGSVLVDGKEIHTYSFESLRNQIGYVPQDVFLFSDTIANNIRFGLNHATQEDIVEAAKHASFEAEAQRLPEKFDTIIGERGITLSGGQKQRVSIARALIKNPPVLVLDDCLSAVDANTEHIILNNLNKVITGKTTILITHRIFSLMDFDKIIVLDDGRIAEEGTHEQLMTKRGLYSKIYDLQRQEDENKSDVIF